MTPITAESFTSPPRTPLAYRLAWKLLGWGFGRDSGFWIADAYLSFEPRSAWEVERTDGTLAVWLGRSRLEISVEPRHIVRMIGLVKVGLLLTAAVAGGWWLRG
jgi:hypothetical protein